MWLSPAMKAAKQIDSSRAPIQSSGSALSRWGMRFKIDSAATVTAMPMGTLMKKITRQEKCSRISPPSAGPVVRPVATTMPTRPRTRPLSVTGKASTTNACEQAMIMAAPMPCKAREAMRRGAPAAMAHSREPMENTTNPVQ